jgi:hypothetical protein
VAEREEGPDAIIRQITTDVSEYLTRMDRTGFTEDQQNELNLLVLGKMLELFEVPVKPMGKLIPWPKSGPF